MWVAVPAMLVQAGLGGDQHWQVYPPAVVLSFSAMGGLFALERRGACACLLGAIGLVLGCRPGWGLVASGAVPSLWVLGPLLFVFFADSTRWRPASPAWCRAWRRPGAGRGAGQLQHAAVAGPVCWRSTGGRAGEMVGPRGLVCRHHCAHGPVAGRVLEAAPVGAKTRLAPGTENPPEGALPTQHLGAAPGLPPAGRLRHNGGFSIWRTEISSNPALFIARYSHGIHQQSHHRR